MENKSKNLKSYVDAIDKSGLSIYDKIEIGDPILWIPTPDLEVLLDKSLRGSSLANLPIRTRSKVAKQYICRALGYPIPSSFKKTQPRFPGQRFDTYVQKANNLQVWNEQIEPTRRYVLIQVSSEHLIERVKVVSGETLALLDTTGTLTQKYQARLIPKEGKTAELIAEVDTDKIKFLLTDKEFSGKFKDSPIDNPRSGQLLSILEIFKKANLLLGKSFPDSGHDQERNRGAKLHQLVCRSLGYQDYQDDGRFPDIRHQLLEVKLQTSPTIDLGLVCPDSEEILDIIKLKGRQVRHCDVRYAIFYATTDGAKVTLTHFYLTTGEKFFSRFRKFQGKVLNKKIQIPLPKTFFDRESKSLPNKRI